MSALTLENRDKALKNVDKITTKQIIRDYIEDNGKLSINELQRLTGWKNTVQ